MEEIEAGLVLVGTEVKSLREGHGSIKEAFAKVIEGEVFLIGSHISPYEKGGYVNHEPFRKRKLLLHKKQIQKLSTKVFQKGFTLVPLKLYFKNGYAKLLIGLARGKKQYDKREDLKKKEAKRTMDREIRGKY